MKELYGFVQDANQKSTMYPIFIVSLQFPGHEVDVNLEPNKSQVLMKRHVNNIFIFMASHSQVLYDFNTCRVMYWS